MVSHVRVYWWCSAKPLGAIGSLVLVGICCFWLVFAVVVPFSFDFGTANLEPHLAKPRQIQQRRPDFLRKSAFPHRSHVFASFCRIWLIWVDFGKFIGQATWIRNSWMGNRFTQRVNFRVKLSVFLLDVKLWA